MDSMQASSKLCVRYLSGLVRSDLRTVMGRTVYRIGFECNIDRELVTYADARNVRYFPPPLEQEWRIPILLELLDAREGRSVIPGMDSAEIELLINHVCTD